MRGTASALISYHSKGIFAWVSLILAIMVTFIFSVITIAFNLELNWPCAFEPSMVWVSRGCGMGVLVREGFLFLGIPLSAYLALSGALLTLTLAHDLSARRSNAKLIQRLSFVTPLLFAAVAAWVVYVTHVRMSLPFFWGKLALAVALIGIVARIVVSGPVPRVKPAYIAAGFGCVFLLAMTAGYGVITFMKYGIPDIASRSALEASYMNDIVPAHKHVLGSPDAPNALVLFLDPNCIHSLRVLEQAEALATSQHNLNFIVRPFSLKENKPTLQALSAIEEISDEHAYWAALNDLFHARSPGNRKKHPLEILNADPQPAANPLSPGILSNQRMADRMNAIATPVILVLEKGKRVRIGKRSSDLSYYINS